MKRWDKEPQFSQSIFPLSCIADLYGVTVPPPMGVMGIDDVSSPNQYTKHCLIDFKMSDTCIKWKDTYQFDFLIVSGAYKTVKDKMCLSVMYICKSHGRLKHY